jgi:hypothetical protein
MILPRRIQKAFVFYVVEGWLLSSIHGLDRGLRSRGLERTAASKTLEKC